MIKFNKEKKQTNFRISLFTPFLTLHTVIGRDKERANSSDKKKGAGLRD